INARAQQIAAYMERVRPTLGPTRPTSTVRLPHAASDANGYPTKRVPIEQGDEEEVSSREMLEALVQRLADYKASFSRRDKGGNAGKGVLNSKWGFRKSKGRHSSETHSSSLPQTRPLVRSKKFGGCGLPWFSLETPATSQTGGSVCVRSPSSQPPNADVQPIPDSLKYTEWNPTVLPNFLITTPTIL
ncbi:hypothetical protein BDK51DRAFT_28447, partial [Blyttiomyces helicus]